MRKKSSDSSLELAEYLVDLGTAVIQQEKTIKKIGRLLFASILGFSALGTYLIIKNNS